jgi:hypothetical protein
MYTSAAAVLVLVVVVVDVVRGDGMIATDSIRASL